MLSTRVRLALYARYRPRRRRTRVAQAWIGTLSIETRRGGDLNPRSSMREQSISPIPLTAVDAHIEPAVRGGEGGGKTMEWRSWAT